MLLCTLYNLVQPYNRGAQTGGQWICSHLIVTEKHRMELVVKYQRVRDNTTYDNVEPYYGQYGALSEYSAIIRLGIVLEIWKKEYFLAPRTPALSTCWLSPPTYLLR